MLIRLMPGSGSTKLFFRYKENIVAPLPADGFGDVIAETASTVPNIREMKRDLCRTYARILASLLWSRADTLTLPGADCVSN